MRRRIASVPGAGPEPLEPRALLALILNGLTPTAGQPTGPVTVATFGTLDVAGFAPADYVAMINWGDGSVPEAGQLVHAGSLIGVQGSHTYLQATAPGAPETISVSVANKSGDAPASAQSNGSVNVRPAGVTLVGSAVSASKGVSATATVATFTDANPTAVAGSVSALIDWGDGTPATPGTVGRDGQGPGFVVTGAHAYSTSGTFATTITVSDLASSGRVVQATVAIGAATVSASPTAISGQSRLIVAAANAPLPADQVVASFTYRPPAGSPAPTFAATIDWGDGHTTGGTVVPGASTGSYLVEGTNVYATPGTYAVTATVADQLGNQAQVASSATATGETSSPPTLTGGLDPSADGPGASVGSSGTNRPTFSGKSTPFALVKLFGRPAGVDANIFLGETIVGADGRWSLLVGPLADGIYQVTGVVAPASGPTSGAIPLGPGTYTIDTAPPVLVGASSDPSGHVYLKFRDDLSGMSPSGLADPANYTFAGARPSRPVAVKVLPGAGLPTDVVTVKLTPGGRGKLKARVLRIAAQGITDLAGNALGKVAHGQIVAPNGRASGNVLVRRP